MVECLARLHAETERDFELFIAYRSRPWLQEHLTFIDGKPVDLAWLKEAILMLAKSELSNSDNVQPPLNA